MYCILLCLYIGLLVLQVQRNWMYLENIFIGSEDIRKQLPQESVMFDQVHATFMAQMQQLNTAHNVVQVGCSLTNIRLVLKNHFSTLLFLD